MLELYSFDKANRPKVEEVLQAALNWHFSEETGSPFWLEKRKELGFNPLVEIKTLDDLGRFPDYSEELKTVPTEKLIPQGLLNKKWSFEVFESGGTTGAPQKIVDSISRKKALEWVYKELESQDVFNGVDGHWLHIGPTGPHIVGRSIGRLAHFRSKLCYYIDFDPRWVKKCSKNGDMEGVKAYIQHILDQAQCILSTQNVSVLFATPAVLEAISKRSELAELIRSKIKLILWAGTSIEEETLDGLEQYIFPEAKFVGLYGNTLMGIAPQRPRFMGDTRNCVFQSFSPFSIVQVVDKDNSNLLVPYHEYGQVKLTLLSPELFIPSRLERDQAIRIPPAGEYTWDGVADIRPMESLRGRIFEGVY
ncbi:hypothetical protein [Paenibacillus caui]|uniref:hypothetical protein n=1 Tax=Paenibacillus caui TaxID=2873927 RepID=UPI001CA812EC|nr:hypothetical protein [Paenibacillus caui]